VTVWPDRPPSPQERAAYADAEPRPFWALAAAVSPALEETVEADLCIVGGGFTGLWAALHAKAHDPVREVVLLEAERIGFGASGRNGGFCMASLTHGIANGEARFAGELDVLERLGRESFDGLLADLSRLGVDCDLELTGELTALLEPYQDAWLQDEGATLRRYGHDVVLLDGEAMRAEIASPTYRGGIWDRTGAGVLDPGKLCAGLRDAALRLGVRVFEHTAADSVCDGVVITASGRVRARRVLLATSAYPPLLRSLRRFVAPVYDYVLVTEPLSAAQLESIAWKRRQGVGDAGNRFHYYRLTADDRILFGGYEAVYRYGGRVAPRFDQHDATFATLSQHFFTTFPQLRGLRFTHRWGGAIDTCSRFSVFFGTAHGGRTAYALGYTGLGVGAARFGARVALDLLDGRATEATRLKYVRSRPVPFPPEPLRSAVIQLTRNRLAAADAREGRRGLWLGLLDRLGLGFDS
jgi:glycine/D-amino acid oxidase-like deaminating enzyme